MDHNKFDVALKERIAEGQQQLPDVVRSKVDQTLMALPPKKQKRSIRLMMVSSLVAAMFALVIGFGAFSPQLALAINQPDLAESLEDLALVQTVKSIFNMKTTRTQSEFVIPEVDLLREAYANGQFSKVGLVAEDRDIQVEITEVLYDGVQVSIGFIYTSPENFKVVPIIDEEGEEPPIFRDMNHYIDELNALKSELQSIGMDVYINGETLSTYGNSITGEFIDPDRFAGIIHLLPGADGFPDQFEMDVVINKIGKYAGNWPFSLHVEKNDRSTVQFAVGQSISYEGATITVESITFAPSGVEVVWRQNRAINGIIMHDDQGGKFSFSQSLGQKITDEEDEHFGEWLYRSRFKAVEHIPPYLTIGPEKFDRGTIEERAAALEEMVMKIELTP